jgi:hypothetical protein
MTYAYDAMGRRTSKTVGSGTPTQYLCDSANAVQETQGSTINPILVGLNVDERFARNDTTGRTYFLSRHLQEMLGHTSIESTQIYTRVTINDLRATHHQFHPREQDQPKD